MKIFISWSGTTSRAVAEALHAWLPKVLQGVEPFLSARTSTRVRIGMLNLPANSKMQDLELFA